MSDDIRLPVTDQLDQLLSLEHKRTAPIDTFEASNTISQVKPPPPTMHTYPVTGPNTRSTLP